MDLKKYNKYILLEDGSYSNFKYIEFIRSEMAIRNNISNEPNIYNLQNMEILVQNGLQPVRDKFGPIRITSGYRSSLLCLAIGSNVHSNHINGGTADIEPINSNIPLIDILNFIHSNLDYRELIAEFFPNGWIHYSYLQDNNKKELKLKDSDHNYDLVSIDYINSIYKS